MYRCLYSYTQNQPLQSFRSPTILKILFQYSANTCDIILLRYHLSHPLSFLRYLQLEYYDSHSQITPIHTITPYVPLHHSPALLDISLHTLYILNHTHVASQPGPNLYFGWMIGESWSDRIHGSFIFIWHPTFIPLLFTISFWFIHHHLYSHSWYDFIPFLQASIWFLFIYFPGYRYFTTALHYIPISSHFIYFHSDSLHDYTNYLINLYTAC